MAVVANFFGLAPCIIEVLIPESTCSFLKLRHSILSFCVNVQLTATVQCRRRAMMSTAMQNHYIGAPVHIVELEYRHMLCLNLASCRLPQLPRIQELGEVLYNLLLLC